MLELALTVDGLIDGTPALTAAGALTGNESFLISNLWGHEYLTTVSGGRYFADVEKTITDEGDDDLCWAAAAVNILTWGGWTVNGMADFANEDRAFDYLRSFWPDAGGFPESGAYWWIAGTVYWGAPYEATPGGGGFFPGLNPADFVVYRQTAGYSFEEVTGRLSGFFQAGYGITLNLQGAIAHAITAWGFERIDNRFYLWISDSDDDKNIVTDDRADARNYLYRVEVRYDARYGYCYLSNYHGLGNSVYLYSFTAIKQYDKVFSGEDETRADARTITHIAGATVQRYGNIDAAGDNDYYRFTARESGEIVISVDMMKTYSTGAVQLTVYRGDEELFTSVVSPHVSWTLNAEYGVDYYLEITGTPGGGTGTGDNTYIVTLSPPSVPEAPLPDNLNAETVRGVVSLSWDGQQDGALRYVLEFSTTAGFLNGTIVKTAWTTETTFTTDELPEGSYYWRVKAGMDGQWVYGYAVTVDRTPPERVFDFAATSREGALVCTWRYMADQDSLLYMLEYSETEDFSDAVSQEVWQGEAKIPIDREGYYWVRLRAVDRSANEGAWSPAKKVYHDLTGPNAPQTWDARVYGDTVRCEWSKSVDLSGVREYELEYSLNADFSEAQTRYSADSKLTLFTMPAGLWYWRVRAVDNAGNRSEWSVVREIRVAVTAPETAPPEIAGDRVTLRWSAVAGRRYRVQYSTSADWDNAPSEWVEGGSLTLVNLRGDQLYWRVMYVDENGLESGWTNGTAVALNPVSYETAEAIDGGAGDDRIFFAATDFRWSGCYRARYAGSPDHPEEGETVSLGGLNRSYDRFDGGTGYDVLELTGEGDALLLDNRYLPAPGTAGTPRLANIEEIRAGGGDDVVDLSSSTLAYGDVVIRGGDGDDVLWSGGGNDLLFGDAGADVILGGDGNDFLNGGSGADRLAGGRGDDLYVVDQAGDRTVERAGEGVDTVLSFCDWKLADHVENLKLLGTGDLCGEGNSGDNRLYGNSGDNRLLGGGGTDTFVFTPDWGTDTVSNTDGVMVLFFAGGITETALSVERQGDDLVVSLDGSRVTACDWYLNENAHRIVCGEDPLLPLLTALEESGCTASATDLADWERLSSDEKRALHGLLA